MEEIFISELSVIEILNVLKSVTPERSVVIRGKLDIAIVERESTLGMHYINLIDNSFNIPQNLLYRHDFLTETYNINELAKALYDIESNC